MLFVQTKKCLNLKINAKARNSDGYEPNPEELLVFVMDSGRNLEELLVFVMDLGPILE